MPAPIGYAFSGYKRRYEDAREIYGRRMEDRLKTNGRKVKDRRKNLRKSKWKKKKKRNE